LLSAINRCSILNSIVRMEKEISELAYKDTASMTKKEIMNGTATNLFFFCTIGIIVSITGRIFQAKYRQRSMGNDLRKEISYLKKPLDI